MKIIWYSLIIQQHEMTSVEIIIGTELIETGGWMFYWAFYLA